MLDRSSDKTYRTANEASELSVANVGSTYPRSQPTDLQAAIDAARSSVLAMQQPDGHWCYELEADCTISAEYILMMHYMDEIDVALQQKIAVYLRAKQCDHGGWSLYTGGEFDISASVKAYYALKLVGDDINEAHMQRARKAILKQGGAAKSNVFTRITLALFKQVPWRAVPFIPAEIMLLPKWFPFQLNKVSYWSRTVLVPLTILYSLKAEAKNPTDTDIKELFTKSAFKERHYFSIRSLLNGFILLAERILGHCEIFVPDFMRQMSIKKAEAWFVERLNGEDGLGAIFPAMVNAYEALAELGYSAEHEYRVTAKKALEKLLVVNDDYAYCQPCLSPVWDTALAALAVYEANGRKADQNTYKALDWLVDLQLLDAKGDWQERAPNVRGGGWAFQYRNDYYPDIDDTAAVAWAMLDIDKDRYQHSISRAVEWVAGMQSKNGGFGAFDVNNTFYYLNEIPFADHGALLDPPTSDVSARCLFMLGHHDHAEYNHTLNNCLKFLYKEQETDGAWFGRWGTNYIYGTWSVLTGLERTNDSSNQLYVKRAVKWLKQIQREDGGWGEGNDTYFYPEQAGQSTTSTAFQTAWALLALMAAGEVNSDAVEKGIQFLLQHQDEDGLWYDEDFTAPGFPRVFYLKYHGYDKFFPLWALARYRNLTNSL